MADMQQAITAAVLETAAMQIDAKLGAAVGEELNKASPDKLAQANTKQQAELQVCLL